MSNYYNGYREGHSDAREAAAVLIVAKDDIIQNLGRVIDVKNQAIVSISDQLAAKSRIVNSQIVTITSRNHELAEATKLIATLQQSLDEANAIIDAAATPKPGEFKVGDKVRAIGYTTHHDYIVEKTRVNDEGRQLVSFKDFAGFWFSDKYELVENKPAFLIGDRVRSNKGHFFRIRAFSEDGKKVQSEMTRLWYDIEEYGIHIVRAPR